MSWTDSSPHETGFRIERSATGTGAWAMAGSTSRNVTSFNDAGRASEQQVCYRVFAILRNGLSNPSNTSCTIPPAAPTGLTATIVDHQAIDLAWSDNSAAEDGYQVERAPAQAGPYEAVAFLAANTNRYRQSGLTTNTTYWYRVSANNDGGFSDISNVVSATPAFTVPAAPSALSARPSGTHVILSWVDNAGNEDGFQVERSLDLGATWTTTVTLPYRDRTIAYAYGTALEQTACYRVAAYNGQGASAPSEVDCTAIPAAPSGLTASPIDQPAIDLSWTDNSSVEDGYAVYRGIPNVEAYRKVADVPANSMAYRDAGVSADITYRYYVQATRDGGESYSTNIASTVVATVAPNAPVEVHPIPWGSTAVGVIWTDNSTNEEGFRVDRSTDGGASWVTVGTSWFAAYYPYQFVDGGRITEEQVCYRVIAYNRAGDSPASDPGCTTPPAAPTNLTATRSPEGVLVTWNDNSAVEDGYYLVLITDCSEQPEYWEGLPANSASYLDTWPYWCFGPTLGYYVVATKDGGWSDFFGPVYNDAAGSAAAAAAARQPPPSMRWTRAKP
ncbi:MAG TPA: fibronectin type III domain-containing protein [Gemmatimonadales bacterium]|nr:fibronectin type III domain-containing protein [Gemmatimonadales bacterium]